MRISDWSSDVCSSDLIARRAAVRRRPLLAGRAAQPRGGRGGSLRGRPLGGAQLRAHGRDQAPRRHRHRRGGRPVADPGAVGSPPLGPHSLDRRPRLLPLPPVRRGQALAGPLCLPPPQCRLLLPAPPRLPPPLFPSPTLSPPLSLP